MLNCEWTGSYLQGSTVCAIVKYRGPRVKGSVWLATIKRDAETTWKGSATFQEGPIVAALNALAKAGVAWPVTSSHTIDSDTYCIGF